MFRKKDSQHNLFQHRRRRPGILRAAAAELKRRHGLGALRVRGRWRVELAVYLKALACNVKRMVRALMPTPGAWAPAMG